MGGFGDFAIATKNFALSFINTSYKGNKTQGKSSSDSDVSIHDVCNDGSKIKPEEHTFKNIRDIFSTNRTIDMDNPSCTQDIKSVFGDGYMQKEHCMDNEGSEITITKYLDGKGKIICTDGKTGWEDK